MISKFWMVFVEGSATSKYPHESRNSAMLEAARLALLSANEGKRVYIMEAVGSCITAKPPLEWEDPQ